MSAMMAHDSDCNIIQNCAIGYVHLILLNSQFFLSFLSFTTDKIIVSYINPTVCACLRACERLHCRVLRKAFKGCAIVLYTITVT